MTTSKPIPDVNNIFEGGIAVVEEDVLVTMTDANKESIDVKFQKGCHHLVYRNGPDPYVLVFLHESEDYVLNYYLTEETLTVFSRILQPGDEEWHVMRHYLGPNAIPYVPTPKH